MTKDQPNKLELLEEDIAKLFHHHTSGPDIWDYSWSFIKGISGFIILFILFFGIINFPAYEMKLGYFLNQIISGNGATSSTSKSLKLLEPLSNDRPLKAIDEDKSAPGGQTLAEFLRLYVPENYLVIPSIDVKAPIIWTSPPDKILEDLKKGISHYGGTALPDENGNVFLTGHSSNYWWDDGQYKHVFALLDNIKNNDRIYLTYKNQSYVYQVEDTKVVSPNQIEVLDPKGYSMVTLMTCTPVGTTINRRIVQAKQIYPLANNQKSKELKPPSQLPIVR